MASDDDIYERLKPGEELPAVVAINEAVGKLYGGRFADSWATTVSWALGGPDPLDRVRCYRAKDHWHYVSYGCSDLDEKSHPDSKFSGFGFELTFRLRDKSKTAPLWPVQLLQSLVRYVYKSKSYFNDGDYFPFNAAWQEAFHVPGVIFTADPEVAPITTEYGELGFLQVVGVDKDCIARIAKDPQCWDEEVAAIRKKNPLLVTVI